MYTDRQLEHYFQRVGLSGALPPTGETLSRIQLAQQRAIPYENIDLLRKIPLKLDPEALFKKMVDRHRGGYCFEVNGLLSHVLRSAGFDVTDLAARVLLGKKEMQMRRHRVLKVEASDGVYLVDAGMNREMQRIALKLTDGEEQNDGVAAYRLESEPVFGHVLYQRLPGKAFEPIYSFTEEPQADIDYAAPSYWCETHPDSPLNKALRVSIVRGREHLSMNGGEFVRFSEGRVQEKKTISQEEQPRVLADVFGLAGF